MAETDHDFRRTGRMYVAPRLRDRKWRHFAAFAARFTPALLAGMLLPQPENLLGQQRTTDANPRSQWEVLEGCRLLTKAEVDGDSFHVVHKDREYIFRLYFVDTPETDPALKDRAQDQAAYFGIPVSDIPRAGELAAKFTRDKLADRSFTVITRWQNAMGRSSLARFYCVALVDGNNLAEELVVNGLARIYGLRANWPDGPRSATFINQLKNLELQAREHRRGVWDERAFPRLTTPVSPPAAETNGTPSPLPNPSPLVNVNTATSQELQKLPGIGPKLAERIIAYRPYEKVEDLDKVPGIGPKTLERLRPQVRVNGTPP